jgi:hypothetical protein
MVLGHCLRCALLTEANITPQPLQKLKIGTSLPCITNVGFEIDNNLYLDNPLPQQVTY